MPAITTLIAIAGVAASVGGVVQATITSANAAAEAKKQAAKAKAALQAKKPSDTTEAEIKLAKRDKELKRGKGSLAQRKRKELQAGSAGGLETKSASEVGGL